MKESLGEYQARDGRSLAFRKWAGAGDVLVLVHGIESNSIWFRDFISHLNRQGFAIYGIDRRGSGLNEFGRGDIEDYKTFFNDIEDAIRFIGIQHPRNKIYLMGICWGGLLAVNYAISSNIKVDGLILLSPALYRKVDFSLFKKAIARICLCLKPRMHFTIPIKDGMFTTNAKYLSLIKNDKMRLRTLSARFFNQIIKMENEMSPLNHQIEIPVLVLLAGHDDIVDNKKVEQWFGRLISKDKELRIFSDFHHVMPFEEDSRPLADFISHWAKSREASGEKQYIES